MTDFSTITEFLECDYDQEFVDSGLAMIDECFSNNSYKNDKEFPTKKLLQIFFGYLENENISEDAKNKALKNIHFLLENIDDSLQILVSEKFEENLKKTLNKIVKNEAPELLPSLQYIISSISLIVTFDPENYGKKIGTETLFMALNYVKSQYNDLVVCLLQNIAEVLMVRAAPAYASYIQYLTPFLKEESDIIFAAAVNAADQLLLYCNLMDVNQSTGTIIIEALNRAIKMKNEKIIGSCFNCLLYLSQNPIHWNALTSSTIDFSPALTNQEAENSLLTVSMNVLPKAIDLPIYPSCIKPENVIINCGKPAIFAEMIKPVVRRIILEKRNFSINFLYIFIIILQLVPFTVDSELLSKLTSISTNPNYACYVLKIASLISNQEGLYTFDLIPNLAKTPLVFVARNLINWYFCHLEPLLAKYNSLYSKKVDLTKNASLADLFEQCKTLSPNILVNRGFIEAASALIKTEGVDKIINLLSCMLENVTIPYIDVLSKYDHVQFSRKSYDFLFNQRKADIEIIETGAFFDWALSDINFDELQNVILRSKLSEIFSFENFQNSNNTEKGYALMIFCPEIITKDNDVVITYKDKEFPVSANDNVFQVACANIDNIGEVLDVVVTKKVKRERKIGCFTSLESNPVNMIPKELKKMLDFLKVIHENNPTKNLIFEKFEQKIRPLSSAGSMVTGRSIQTQIVANYPFLFSPDLRRIVYFINTLEMSSALNKIGEFLYKTKPNVCKKMHVLAKVDREKLWENGCLILDTYGKTQVRIDFTFKGEEGYGFGPTNEFFSLMSKEFARNERRMWQTDNKEAVYAFKEGLGLIPDPEGDARNFFLFGIFCAKAIQLNAHVSIPLSTAFIKLFLEREVLPEDIGYSRDKLEANEGLYDLQFVFPGTNIELKEGGRDIYTNESNINEFIQLISKMIKGKLWANVMNEFKRGYYTIMKRGFAYLLSPEEFKEILVGEQPRFSYKEFKESIQIYSGFEKDDQEIEWLAQVVTSLSDEDAKLFIKFVTGSDVLPAGGIKSLNPPINVSLKLEKELPSASTCTNYLKISRYQSKEELQRDLLTAIRECTSFLLS